ncbi:hypothetical protein [Planomonospora algeriensis]
MPGRNGSSAATRARPASWESTTTASTCERRVASPPKKSAVPYTKAQAVARTTAVIIHLSPLNCTISTSH